MQSWQDVPEEMEMAFVNSSGKLMESTDFTFVNLRLAGLDVLLEDMIANDMDVKVLCPTVGGIEPLYVEKLDQQGRLWRTFQMKRMETEEIASPEIRFFYKRDSSVLRPIDYRDPYVQLEGTDRTSQLLIASFMMHWLSGILAFYTESTVECRDNEDRENREDLASFMAQHCGNPRHNGHY